MDHATLTTWLGDVADWRREHRRFHGLADILFLCLCATLCGADTFTQIAYFGEARLDWLRRWLPYANGIPSHDTLRRVLQALDPQVLASLLTRWARAMQQLTPQQVVSVDGKALRGTWESSGGSGLTLVSLWASEARLCLGVAAVGEKGGEVAAAQTVLGLLDVAGTILTADAGFTHKAFAAQVVAREADYVLALRGNQPTLLAQAESVFATVGAEQVASYETQEKNRGRIETRHCQVTERLGHFGLEAATGWAGLRTLVKLDRQRVVRQQGEWVEQAETRYYLSSLPADAALHQAVIRQHWGIENQQHWLLDVVLREDQVRIRSEHAPENLALCRRIALNLAQAHKPEKISFKGALYKATLSTAMLQQLLFGTQSDA